ncbi:hypothetical protein [Bradyrhizobium sp. SZCCHNS3052]|uniref:hypothetical protein n=1 Tax=Bradyrhizobium sp. SZCCHNS3052 TaxID=3057321 RepID=UPI0029163F7F|nr:hypothetical protein [Bradyrhizobium sp. SZCCHNS3052]
MDFEFDLKLSGASILIGFMRERGVAPFAGGSGAATGASRERPTIMVPWTTG